MKKEENRVLDSFFYGRSNQKEYILEIIRNILNTPLEEIHDITILKQGMTNRSFSFSCGSTGKYIMRIPGEGTNHLINRRQEAAVYQVLSGTGLCDEVLYLDPESGCKLTRFLEGSRVCDPRNAEDVKKCMGWLRGFHAMGLWAAHEFDIFQQIDFYETLWDGAESAYKDYAETKQKIFSLQSCIHRYAGRKVLAHIDAVPDNFLFVPKEGGQEEIRLIDWEYAGMQEPLVDIAMFCIYSCYEREAVDRTISMYFPEGCTETERIMVYCYIAAGGLLWSNWCEYKKKLGVDFQKYSLRQYCYAKEYFQAVQDMLKKIC